MSIARVWGGGHVLMKDVLRHCGHERKPVAHVAMGRVDGQKEEHRTEKPRYRKVA